MRGQEQTAGENSSQYQARRDLNVTNVTNVGLSAGDVIEIVRVELAHVREELALKAEAAAATADARFTAFERRIVDAFAEDENLRGAFADPDFQFSLRDASRAAVSNDDEHTEDLLVDLLKNRAEQGNQSRVRLTTSRAIQAADKLSLEALHGLTATWAIGSLGPMVPGLGAGLAAHEGTATAVIAMGLPEDLAWTEDADALGLIRLVTGGLVSRKPYRQALQEALRSYLNPGIDLETSRPLIEQATTACGSLTERLAPHPLKPGFVVLPGKTREEFIDSLTSECEVSPELEQLVSQNGFGVQDPAAATEFVKKIDESDALSSVATWWDRLPVLDLTVVGRVIGFVNARRHIPFGGARTVAEMLALPRS